MCVPILALPSGVLWGRQYKSSHNDIPISAQADPNGNIVVVGNSDSAATAEAPTGTQFFIAKFRPDGTLIWRTQFKAGLYVEALAVTIDSSSHIYVVGRVEASLFSKQLGDMDAFLGKWSAEGKLIWGRQFGTNAADEADCVAVSKLGQVYVAGITNGPLYDKKKNQGENSFLVTYSSDGQLIASKQYSDGVRPLAIALDGDGEIYIAANGSAITSDHYPFDALLIKYDYLMQLKWSKSTGAPPQSTANGVSIVGNALYVVGRAYDSSGGVNRAVEGTYLTRFRTDGKREWIKTWRRSQSMTFLSVATDSYGNVYTAGFEELSHQLIPWIMNHKAIVSSVSSDGHECWSTSFGAQQHSGITGLVLSRDHLYAVGFTSGDLFGKGNGRTSLFLAELKP